MTKVDDGPCRGCGEPVSIEWREVKRSGGVGQQQFRICGNPACRLKQPGQRRAGDRV